jgi:alpha-1,3-rhamnosyltransferase
MNQVNELSNDTAGASVSVVVPSFNHARFVRQTLTSIIQQTVVPLELIVIDDGSTDESARVIEQTLEECPFPSELYVRGNKGLCKTLIEGLERSRAEYFAYLGSDDIWLPELLEVRLEGLRGDPSAPLAFGHCYKINELNEIGGDSHFFESYEYSTTREMLLYGFPPFSPTVVYRRSALAEDCWNPDIRLEDYDLYLRLSVQGEFAFDSHVLSAWRAHRGNTSGNLDFMLTEETLALERNADALKLSKEELSYVQKYKRLRFVDNYILEGRRWDALRVYLANTGGFPNKSKMIKQGIKALLPLSIQNIVTASRPKTSNAARRVINDQFNVIDIDGS